MTSNEQKVTSNKQKVTGNQQKVISNKKKVKSNEKQAKGNKQRIKNSASNIILYYEKRTKRPEGVFVCLFCQCLLFDMYNLICCLLFIISCIDVLLHFRKVTKSFFLLFW